jgi:septal ring-binding cell division protein DamX
MRRVNILADKALLAAFVENTHQIESRHVQAAIRDSEMVPMRNVLNRKSISMAGGTLLLAATLAGAGWFMGQNAKQPNTSGTQLAAAVRPPVASEVRQEAVSGVTATSEVSQASSVAETSSVTLLPLDQTLTLPAEPAVAKRPAVARETPPAKPVVSEKDTSLLQQRLDSTVAALSAPNHAKVSIQLFYTDNIRPDRLEGFLGRAKRLEKLSQIYIVPVKLNGKDGYRVLYGLYANSDAARAGMEGLPQRYKDGFASTLYMLDDSQ